MEAYLQPDTVRTLRPAPGVRYRFLWSPLGPWAVHVAEVELSRCGLALDVARADGASTGGGGLAQVAEIVAGDAGGGAVVAVNGDFFTPEGVPLGPELTDGRLRTPRERPALAWRPAEGPWIGRARLEGDSALAVGWSVPLGARVSGDAVAGRRGEVVGGYPQLLDGGSTVGDLLVSESPAFAASRLPRTAVGVDPATGRLWLVVVDGRHASYSLGMSLPELAGLLRALGATEALNLDGGGSSVMVLRGHAVSRPSDETGQRPVANALAVRHDPAAYCPAAGGGPAGPPADTP